MGIREWTCRDCGAKGQQAGGGRLRERCDDCQRKADARRMRKARSPLRAVDDAPEPVSPPVPAPELPPAQPVGPAHPVRDAVVDVLAGLDVLGGVTPALRAMALRMADLVDGADEDRAIRANAELRAVLAKLVPERQEVDDVDDFLARLSAPPGHAAPA